MRFHPGIFALLLTPPGLPSGGFHWQRTITPPASAPLVQACVILDAATFANAAPALRDLRLFQDGFELPYVVEESYDPRALDSGTTPPDDRSLYETSLIVDLQRQQRSAGVSGGGIRSLPSPLWSFHGTAVLSAHVPVERIRLDPASPEPLVLDISATELVSDHSTSSFEPIRLGPFPPSAVLPVTLGVNLQHSASVQIRIPDASTPYTHAILEMRRRSLCYQPRSAAPLTLYLGGGEGMAAKTYGYASSFSTVLDRPFATLGPLVPNPNDAIDIPAHRTFTRRKRLLLAATIAALFFAFSANRMLQKPKTARAAKSS